jgi:N-acetylmuramoyl-L-alanine amidase
MQIYKVNSFMKNKLTTLFCYITCLFLVLCISNIVEAATAKEKYLLAEKYFRRLQKNPGHQKYRDKWLFCINKFQDVYRHDPEGPWAAAGMFKSGELYYELYKRSLKKSDKTEALDTFERIIKRYPKSRYRKKAEDALQEIQQKSKLKTKPETKPKTNIQAQKYRQAESCYENLLNSPSHQKYRDKWLACIDKYQQAYEANPAGEFAAECMYQRGALYADLYKRSYKKSDKSNALKFLNDIIRSYPSSSYRHKADKKIMALTGQKPTTADEIAQIIEQSPKEYSSQGNTGSAAPGSQATVKGLRHWSNPSYTRIVIDADAESPYQHRLLKRDPSINKPQRLYVDLSNSRLGKHIEKVVPINDNLLSNVRAGQHTENTVRVVVDIKSFETYKIFSLRNPFRIVIDVWGTSVASSSKQGQPLSRPPSNDREMPPGALAKQLALGVSRIVIDPGHGGRDYGAPGYYKGVHEKMVVLEIAKRLAKKIRETLHCEAILTRKSDIYLTLEERTAIANTQNADLFISIHTNSAKDRRAFGIETFFLNLATDNEAIMVAARENATSAKNISDLETILNDLMQNAKINESSRLAAFVQKTLYTHLKGSYSSIKSKGVKQAPFYVLLGAQMPAILIETSFISNPRECKRLTNAHYQDQLCEAIVKGIQRYIQETNPTALNFSPDSGKIKG